MGEAQMQPVCPAMQAPPAGAVQLPLLAQQG
jgi:hypothetical protein